MTKRMTEPDENETWPQKRKRLLTEKDEETKNGIFEAVPLHFSGDFEDAVLFEHALEWGKRKADVSANSFVHMLPTSEENYDEEVAATEHRCLADVVDFTRKKRKLAQCIEHVDGRYKKLMEEQRVQLAIELFRSVSKH